MALTKTRWWLPLFSLSLGVLCLAAFWIGDDPRSGLYALALMAAVGMLFLAGGRFDLVRGLRETAETSTGSGSTCTRATSQDSSRSGSSSACACGNGRTPEAECRTCSSAPSAVSRTSSRWAFSGGVHEGRGHRARAARGRRDAHGVGQHGRTSGVRVRARDSRTGWAGGRKARPRRRRGCALRALLPRPRTRGAKDNGRPGAPRHPRDGADRCAYRRVGPSRLAGAADVLLRPRLGNAGLALRVVLDAESAIVGIDVRPGRALPRDPQPAIG